jgi:hypothetical protein
VGLSGKNRAEIGSALFDRLLFAGSIRPETDPLSKGARFMPPSSVPSKKEERRHVVKAA